MTIDMRGPDAPAPIPSRERPVTRPPLGRYVLEREIGRGGVGRVHRAWDCQLDRAVAIKVLREEHRAKPEAVRRFLEEARITSRLQHPGIVPIHELGVSPDGRPFFVMRLVSGRSLEQFLRHRDGSAAELPRLLVIFLQVCQAIAYAHSQGVIHRDLKPANVMVGAFGGVTVMDWGLAKVLGEPDLPDVVSAAQAAAELTTRCGGRRLAAMEPPLPGTQVGTVFGTPAYLPPEQARGEIDRVDARADVFGLGSLLCELLTGQPPYTGPDGRAIYDKAAAADLSDAIARLNACPAPLDVVSLAKWCLSPAPSDRPATAGDVVEVMSAHMQAHQRRAEQDLIRFFDLSLDMFCLAGTDGYFHRVNENFPRLLGYPAGELTSHPFVDFVHPDDRARTEAELVRLSAGELCIQFLNRYRHARGDYLWLEWNAQAVLEERVVYAVARDVTDRVVQAEALRAAEQTRAHLAAVVNSAEVAIISTTLDGAILSWNRGAERLFGYPPEEVIGRSVALLGAPGREAEEGAIARLRQCDRVRHHESIGRRKDGTLVPVSVTVSPVADAAGTVLGASQIVRDISDRKRSEAALLESEARLRAVVENAVEAIITIDPAGTIETLNRSAERMFGYPAGELLGRNVNLLMPSPHRERHDGYLAAYLRGGPAKVVGRTLILEGRRKDHSTFPIELSVTEFRVGDRLRFSGVVRDITARRRHESLAAEQERAVGFLSATTAILARAAILGEAVQAFADLSVRHLGAAVARVWTLTPPDQALDLRASAGPSARVDGYQARVPLGKSRIGRIARDRRSYVTNTVADDPGLCDPAWAAREGIVAFAGHPLVVGHRLVGVSAVFARHPLSDASREALNSASDSLALCIRGRQLEDEVRNLRAATALTGG